MVRMSTTSGRGILKDFCFVSFIKQNKNNNKKPQTNTKKAHAENQQQNHNQNRPALFRGKKQLSLPAFTSVLWLPIALLHLTQQFFPAPHLYDQLPQLFGWASSSGHHNGSELSTETGRQLIWGKKWLNYNCLSSDGNIESPAVKSFIKICYCVGI